MTEHSDITTEHALLMSGGSLQLYDADPAIERVYPMTERIQRSLLLGHKVYRRQVIVLTAWEEVNPD